MQKFLYEYFNKKIYQNFQVEMVNFFAQNKSTNFEMVEK